MSIYGIGKKMISGLDGSTKEWVVRIIGGREGWFLKSLRARAKHNEIYDKKYYDHVEAGMSISARVITESLCGIYTPRTVVDIGCGSGALLQEFNLRGLIANGLEYSDAAIAICRSRGLAVDKFDLECGVKSVDKRFDLCVSTEVAEHIPKAYSNDYVSTLCNHSDVCVITAATPGQGGTDHVNEQPNEFWIALFESHDFVLDKERTHWLRHEWKLKGAQSWYSANVMVFLNRSVVINKRG